MLIEIDDRWLPIFDGAAWKRVLRDGFVVGRIKRFQAGSEGEMTREWFTVERMIEGRYTSDEGTHPTFQEALECLVIYDEMVHKNEA